MRKDSPQTTNDSTDESDEKSEKNGSKEREEGIRYCLVIKISFQPTDKGELRHLPEEEESWTRDFKG